MGRKIIVSALAGTLALAATGLAPGVGASAADAQEPRAEAREHRMRGGDPIQRLLDRQSELGLTATQMAQLEQIRTELTAKNQPLHQQMRAARQDGARASGERAPIREMTPEQRRAAMEQRREQRQQMTEEQRRANMQQRRERRQQMTEDEREAMRAQREARMAAVRPIMEQARANSRAAMEQVNSVLTEEQRAKVRASREARRQQSRERGEDRPRQRHGGHQQGHGR